MKKTLIFALILTAVSGVVHAKVTATGGTFIYSVDPRAKFMNIAMEEVRDTLGGGEGEIIFYNIMSKIYDRIHPIKPALIRRSVDPNSSLGQWATNSTPTE